MQGRTYKVIALPLAHIGWSVVDNIARKACDAFFMDVFGAESVYEILLTPETEARGFDREERLMVIGNTMLIPIAPAGSGEQPDSPFGNMLRRYARTNMWLGVSLRVADLSAAASWFTARGFKPRFDPGMESHYFLIHRKEVLGMRVEIMQGELPNDPRLKDDWQPQRWRDAHPLGIEGLQSIGISTASLDMARRLFVERFEWPELSRHVLDGDKATCAAFLMGDTVIEAMQPNDDNSPLAEHCRDIQGIYCITFKVKSAVAAANYLRGRGFELCGDVATRFAIVPAQAHGRLIYFTEHVPEAYPSVGSLLRSPAVFPKAL
jgi:catechol 2,3-dioxygenase-like lactoylglutathione lyase family enzyme